MRTRPGYTSVFSTGVHPITDVGSYATLGTDNLPRYLARDSVGGVYLDTGTLIATMTTPAGYGASMLPWRPSQSPQAWMYIASESDYRKFSAPDGANAVTNYKVGIAEPQVQVEAAPQTQIGNDISGVAANWGAGGTAGTLSDVTLINDTATAIFPDPAISGRYSVQVSTTYPYIIGELVVMTGFKVAVEDVCPPIAAGSSGLTILAIRYASGASGACEIACPHIPIGDASEVGQIGSLRRGALVNLGGSEVVRVASSALGPNGAVSFQCSTSGTHSAGETITGIASIVVGGINGSVVGNPITSNVVASSVTSGIGSISQILATSPFAQQYGATGILPTEDDYVRILLNVGNPLNIQSIAIYFNVGPVFDLTEAYVYTVTGTFLVNNAHANLTEIIFPVSALLTGANAFTANTGGDNRSLANCNGVSLQITCSATVAFQFGSFWIGGGGQPDIGADGAPYKYKIIPRSTATGAQGNASPTMRYGVSPRRQNVAVTLPSVASELPAADAQVDIWDVYRDGGSVTSYRYIGSGFPSTTFIDSYFDETALAGAPMPEQNFEPWPSVDVPFSVSAGITVIGTQIVIASLATVPATITRWLPGTLVNIGGQAAYTLRSRPTLISGTTYLLNIVECAGSLSPSRLTINEPLVARQINPYVWGPDANGYFFGVGDPLRPGFISYCDAYSPDTAPSTNNADICPPSEPLLNGAILSGFSFAASSDRWWQMYPAFTGTNVFTPFQVSVGRGLAAPYGICTDKQEIFFWAKDCIAAHAGGTYKSLTDLDLYTLFPHEGVPGKDITRLGVTFYAPDYSRSATFRLAHVHGYLFADYQDTSGTPRTLVCDLKGLAWSSDAYANSVTCRHALEQPEGALTTGAPALYPLMVMGSTNGKVYQESNLTGDDGTAISVVIGTFEYDGGDLRADNLWGDEYIDCLPISQVTSTPVSLGTALSGVSPTVIGAASTRQFTPVSTGGGALANFMGMKITWTDFATTQTAATVVYVWGTFSYDQVDTIADRADDWSNCGTPGNKWFQGFILDADTYDASKSIAIQDDAALTLHFPEPSPIVHNGRQTIPYSFATPFLAHMVKLVPQDQVRWRRFQVEYIFEPSPEAVNTWKTQNTAHGMQGYQHIGRIEAAYSSVASVSLTITAFDGVSPSVITLPSTGGAYQRILLTPTFNKGQLYGYAAVSSGRFQIYLNDWIVYVRQWGSPGPYTPYRLLGGAFGDNAKI